MDKSKKIMIAVIAVLGVICVGALGILIGTRMSQSTPAAETAAEVVTQEQYEPAPTEWVQEYTEPVTEAYEPDEIATAAPTTQATTAWTYAQTTKPQTTKPRTTKAPTTQAPTTQATTTQVPTTQAPTTQAPTTTKAPTTQATTKPATTTANRNGPFALVVNSDNGGYEVSGGGRYSPGEFVKVSMTPRVGYKFVRWESSDTKVLPNSTSQTYVFQMPSSGVSLHAVTQAQTLLTVNKGKGISSVSGAGYYTPGEKVTVYAQMEAGYEFAGWSSSTAGAVSNAQTFSFTMPNKALTLTANAKAKGYALRVSAGTGVRSIVGGDGRYNAGDKVTLYIYMYDGYTLNRWSDLNASYNGNTVTFTMPARDLTLTATGSQNESYIVTITMDGGVRDVYGTGKYAPGSSVTVSCALEDGYGFVAWESDSRSVASSTKSVYTFTMPRSNVNLSVRTKKIETEKYLLTVSKGEGISSVSGGGMFAPGDRVTVSAQVAPGYRFNFWASSSSGMGVPSAGYNSESQTYTFTMPSRPITMTAYAEPIEEEPVFG